MLKSSVFSLLVLIAAVGQAGPANVHFFRRQAPPACPAATFSVKQCNTIQDQGDCIASYSSDVSQFCKWTDNTNPDAAPLPAGQDCFSQTSHNMCVSSSMTANVGGVSLTYCCEWHGGQCSMSTQLCQDICSEDPTNPCVQLARIIPPNAPPGNSQASSPNSGLNSTPGSSTGLSGNYNENNSLSAASTSPTNSATNGYADSASTMSTASTPTTPSTNPTGSTNAAGSSALNTAGTLNACPAKGTPSCEKVRKEKECLVSYNAKTAVVCQWQPIAGKKKKGKCVETTNACVPPPPTQKKKDGNHKQDKQEKKDGKKGSHKGKHGSKRR